MTEGRQYDRKATMIDGGPAVETFVEYGIAYGKQQLIPRSTWSSDPAETAREGRRIERAAAHEGSTLGPVTIVQRTAVYTTTEWSPTTIEALDLEDEKLRSQSGE